MTKPKIVPRSEHGISRRDIDPDALKILYRLHEEGHRAYLVGGGVRDLMLGIRPKDFDIATDARPRRLKRMFRNCRIIGRRFRLAHLHFPGDKIIEVATFRSSGESDEVVREGELIRRDNVFGTPGEDARRRDITINGLFYNIGDFSVIDYVGGVDDLRSRTIRTIVEPERSFREDPVRILRAIRHAIRLDFRIEEDTRRALQKEKHELVKVNHARLLEELYKDLTSGRARQFFETLEREGILDVLIPDLARALAGDGRRQAQDLFYRSLERLDQRIGAGAPSSHAVALGALFSPIVVPIAANLLDPEQAEPHPPWAPFHAGLTPLLHNLRIYRRDEERLWHVLGALPKLAIAFARGKIPAQLSRRSFFQDVVELLGIFGEVLAGGQNGSLSAFLDEARAIPPQAEAEEEEESPLPGRRRRGRRRRAKGADDEGRVPARG